MGMFCLFLLFSNYLGMFDALQAAGDARTQKLYVRKDVHGR